MSALAAEIRDGLGASCDPVAITHVWPIGVPPLANSGSDTEPNMHPIEPLWVTVPCSATAKQGNPTRPSHPDTIRPI
jgi:hypothetical protein